MNILPKKRWHVRTKDNIARVRRDEAEAREQESKKQAKLQLAESEARINFLRKQSGLPERQAAKDETNTTDPNSNEQQQHVDLFADYKSHVRTTNKDLEQEKKEEKEKYEKQIGYLTYLGQDTNEALKLRSWYEVAPKRAIVGDLDIVEKDLKNKYTNDPLTLINVLLPPEKKSKIPAKNSNQKNSEQLDQSVINETKPETVTQNKTEKELKTKSKKHKKNKKHKKEKRKYDDKNKNKHEKSKKSKKKSSKDKISGFSLQLAEQQRKRDMLEKLRKERLRRETTERARQEALLTPKDKSQAVNNTKETSNATPRVVQKYNSQFNPELAKQNML